MTRMNTNTSHIKIYREFQEVYPAAARVFVLIPMLLSTSYNNQVEIVLANHRNSELAAISAPLGDKIKHETD